MPSLFSFISLSPLICVSAGVHVCLSVHFAYVCVHVPDSEDLWREQLDCHWARVHARQHFLFQYFALSRHLAAQLSHIPQIHTGTHSFINSWICKHVWICIYASLSLFLSLSLPPPVYKWNMCEIFVKLDEPQTWTSWRWEVTSVGVGVAGIQRAKRR